MRSAVEERSHARAPLFHTSLRRSFAVIPVAGVAVAKLALHLAFADRYGWHRDELYYFAAGEHLDLGYVDFPPLTPLLAALARELFGASLVGLRSFAILAGSVSVVFAAVIARELGGGRFAQVVAALATAVSPLLLATNGLFQAVSFDQLAWSVVLYVLVRLFQTPRPRLWAFFGLAAGIGLMTKYTIIFLLAAVAFGLLLEPTTRGWFRQRGLWLAGGISLLVFLPNLWWQWRNGWPSVEFFLHPPPSATDESRAEFLLNFLLLAGPLGGLLSIAGLWFVFRDGPRRVLGWASLVVVAGFFILGGKSYYAGPILLPLFSCGAVVLERALTTRPAWLKTAVVTVPVVVILPLLPLALPVLPEREMVERELWEERADYADEIGWPELVDRVALVYFRLPPQVRRDAAIVAANYGEAGAIDLFGARRGLPPAVSGHLSYAYWEPPNLDAQVIVSVGYPRAAAARYCEFVRQAGVVKNHAGIHNEEYGEPILVCRLHGTLAELWPRLRHFS